MARFTLPSSQSSKFIYLVSCVYKALQSIFFYVGIRKSILIMGQSS